MYNVQLDQITFPVYYVGKLKPTVIDGVTFFVQQHVNSEGEDIYSTKVLDDNTVAGETLGARRLALSNRGVALHKLKKAIFFIGDFVKYSKGSIWYIDSAGKLFRYIKTTAVPLIYCKVTKLLYGKQGGCIVEAEGVPGRYKTLFYPTQAAHYAGFLKYNKVYILYGLYDKKYKTSYRKI